MQYHEDHPFYRILATKYDRQREVEAIEILNAHPELALLQWPGPDDQGKPFIRGSTALHYAANDGKLRLVQRLLELGADMNASEANWFRSVLSWAANNARNEVIDYLLAQGAAADSLDAMHAAAWGGSSAGAAGDDVVVENGIDDRTGPAGRILDDMAGRIGVFIEEAGDDRRSGERELPAETRTIDYTLEYGSNSLEIHMDAIEPDHV